MLSSLNAASRLLEIHHLASQPRRFLRQELRGVLHRLVARFQVLVQVQRSELAGHAVGELRRLVLVAHRERDGRLRGPPVARIDDVGADDVHRDVVVHLADEHFRRLVPVVRIEVELRIIRQQIRARHHPLPDHVQALVGEARHRRRNEIRGISCCSIRMVAAARYMGGHRNASATVTTAQHRAGNDELPPAPPQYRE